MPLPQVRPSAHPIRSLGRAFQNSSLMMSQWHSSILVRSLLDILSFLSLFFFATCETSDLVPIVICSKRRCCAAALAFASTCATVPEEPQSYSPSAISVVVVPAAGPNSVSGSGSGICEQAEVSRPSIIIACVSADFFPHEHAALPKPLVHLIVIYRETGKQNLLLLARDCTLSTTRSESVSD